MPTAPIYGTSALKESVRYTVADYRSWTDDVRRELIYGVVYDMSPAPRVPHQDISVQITRLLYDWVADAECLLLVAPIDVYLPSLGEAASDADRGSTSAGGTSAVADVRDRAPDGEDSPAADHDRAGEGGDTVVQPDIIVVCDRDKVRDDGIHGAPDFVVEVLSESTAEKDLTIKRALYEAAGVREYWIVGPTDGSVLAWRRAEGENRFAPVAEYRAGDHVPCEAVPGFVWTARRSRTHPNTRR